MEDILSSHVKIENWNRKILLKYDTGADTEWISCVGLLNLKMLSRRVNRTIKNLYYTPEDM